MDTNPNNPNQNRKRPYSGTEIFWFVVLVLIILALTIFVFQYSWNGSMPHIFGLKPITFVQALLVLIVARMLLPGCSVGM